MYATIEDLIALLGEDRLIRLTDDNGDGLIDAAKVARALTSATGMVNSHVGKRYAVPVEPVPEILKSCASDIAIYTLDRNPSDDTRHRHDDAIKTLTRIAEGKQVLAGAAPADTGATQQPSEAAQVSLPQVAQFKSATDLAGY